MAPGPKIHNRDSQCALPHLFSPPLPSRPRRLAPGTPSLGPLMGCCQTGLGWGRGEMRGGREGRGFLPAPSRPPPRQQLSSPRRLQPLPSHGALAISPLSHCPFLGAQYPSLTSPVSSSVPCHGPCLLGPRHTSLPGTVNTKEKPHGRSGMSPSLIVQAYLTSDLYCRV